MITHTFRCNNQQINNISPKLFSSCLQYTIINNKINWENKGVKIDSEHLSHLIFANGIVLIANSSSKLEEMLQDIRDISKPVGLKVHLGKTKVMCNKHVNKDDVSVHGKQAVTDTYINNKLNWKSHTQAIISCVSKSLDGCNYMVPISCG